MNEPAAPLATNAPLLPWLVHAIGRSLSIAPERVDADADFDELGLDSVQAVGISGALSDQLAQELPATLLYEHRSIRELANYLERRRGAKP